MSRQSLAVNASGVLTGTTPAPIWSSLTVVMMLSGPPGLTSAYSVEISSLAAPAGDAARSDLGPHDDEQVVLVMGHYRIGELTRSRSSPGSSGTTTDYARGGTPVEAASAIASAWALSLRFNASHSRWSPTIR